MIPLRVKAKNYGPYQDVEWAIPPGLTIIVGQNDFGEGVNSNGAGKTKLLELVPIALFGPPLSWSEYLTLGSDGPCEIELEFIGPDSQLYRVRRSYNPSGRGSSTLDFAREEYESADGAYWFPLTQESQLQTEALIEQTIGVTESTFAHSVFAAQGAQHFADPGLTAKDRKTILTEALGLGMWDKLQEMARAEIRALDHEAQLIEMRLVELDGQLAESESITDECNRLREIVEGADQVQADMEELVRAARQARDELTDRQELMTTLEAARLVQSAVAELAEMERRSHQLKPLAERVSELEQQLAAMSQNAQLATQLTVARTRHSAAVASMALIEAGACDRCGQAIQGESLARATEQVLDESEALTTAIADLHDQMVAEVEDLDPATVQATLRSARAAERELAEMEGRAQELGLRAQHAETLDPKEIALDLKQLGGPTSSEEIATIRQRVEDGEDSLRVGAQRVQEARIALARAEEGRDRLGALTTQAVDARERLDQLRTSLGVLNTLDRAYGRNGVPALILETRSIPQIEAEAQRVLQALGTPYRIQLLTQRETKTGTLRDTLDVVVHEPNGQRRYETYSGGERTRLELALRIALARLLVRQSGSRMGLLALDEPAFLDEAGIYQLAAVLVGLLDEFSSIVLISHDEKLVDVFNQVVLIRRENGRSTLVEEM